MGASGKRRLRLLSGLLAVGSVGAETTLTLPIPERESLPRERISLSIRIPEKVEKVEDPPPVRPKVRSPVFDSYEFRIDKPIPRRDFVYETLDRLEKLGIKPDLASSRLRKFRFPEYRGMGRAIWSYYEKLLDIHRKDALAHFEITPLDLERFRQVMDIFSQAFEWEFKNSLEADRNLQSMIELLKKIRGQGTIKVVELKEADDGSMVLNLEVRKEPRPQLPARVYSRR